MSDTPRTDAELWKVTPDYSNTEHEFVPFGFARQLERELTAALAERDEAKAIVQHSTGSALHAITCIHHTDTERSSLPVHGNCLICAKNQADALRADIARLRAIFDNGKGQSGVSILFQENESLRAELAEAKANLSTQQNSLSNTVVRLLNEVAALRDASRRYNLNRDRGSYTGEKCKSCLGSGEGNHERSCSSCGGTGETWRTYKAQTAQLKIDLARVTRESAVMRAALEFYADPETYFAIGFLADPPCGGFVDDFEPFDFEMQPCAGNDPTRRDRPGKTARVALSLTPSSLRLLDTKESQ